MGYLNKILHISTKIEAHFLFDPSIKIAAHSFCDIRFTSTSIFIYLKLIMAHKLHSSLLFIHKNIIYGIGSYIHQSFIKTRIRATCIKFYRRTEYHR